MTSQPATASISPSAETLNRDCFCRTLNMERLREQLESDPSLKGMMSSITQTRPNLFSSTVVFISQAVQQQISATVEAIERVAALPGYQVQALSRADASAQHDFGPLGACMGYDFHLNANGPQLIEVNTNAGGLLLNVALARAQEACCDEMDWAFPSSERRDNLKKTIFYMFDAEWQLQCGTAPWRSVVIVDDAPMAQYLAPEFELFRQLFAQNGIHAAVADPSEFVWQNGRLLHQGTPVDMVYNRLTDFYLAEPNHLALRQAYEANAVVLTPHPRAHALLADKRNLIALSHDELLLAWGASAADRSLLAANIPATRLVTPERADELWAQRRQLFFKPVAGYGAKAAYRGDKLTRRVWNEILEGDFVAQALVPPSGRKIEVDGVQTDLKFDIRAYTYAGQVQLLAARMYAGQTTNFRTQGGGFAPVIVVPAEKIAAGAL
ncbi:MAG: hypothetical protein CO105_00990 [Comamonadaceae bacterium CG_4_9_14_3_um_filter_60_33]|nr:MAG: hypothetical protein AUK51_01910 [Comamonadaceae bacterium CG2_30_59_20]PIY27795.1 MAG: hypothetical protein COZ09_13330 [Comamonadaceae bacterium CG_4_10_14_3_um_filter_60_42]PJB46625.1 MAG: hypothetical protein CO105_00990 [Comamonadaceae bacterium CG_4_9_14_3_um_filter_60_33]